MRLREPLWTEAALQRARLKKAKGIPRAAMPPWRRALIERQAEASVFALILQDVEDRCLMAAVASLARCGWRAHSLRQDGVLVEQGVCADSRPAVPLTLHLMVRVRCSRQSRRYFRRQA